MKTIGQHLSPSIGSKAHSLAGSRRGALSQAWCCNPGGVVPHIVRPPHGVTCRVAGSMAPKKMLNTQATNSAQRPPSPATKHIPTNSVNMPTKHKLVDRALVAGTGLCEARADPTQLKCACSCHHHWHHHCAASTAHTSLLAYLYFTTIKPDKH